MIRLVNALCVLVIITLVTALYHVRYSAEAEMRAVQSVERSMGVERDTQKTLEAEWSSLNDPRRLQGLAKQHLKLDYLKAKQVLDLRPQEIRSISALLQRAGASDETR
ncbi:hypothetical protein OAI46_03115 [Alphaproteobacteria bacterium]|nr:hypothetical protein [Alphaproteobacteria bacterium]MDB2585007.1 hypothetical protein [Alphaproteobacteria bacterium]MDB2668861.1 hypothetical protein [Alphaproteobacteria bacterium]MDC0131803.1 hypothetical protein [Alphaproteobacteria bacterium]MDC0147843.1 hypothetical protein [Alphaproteobacteria bacterium]